MKLRKFSLKSVISMLLVCVMVIGMLPTMGVFAAQTSEYIDPAENWLTSNGRTNELDINATTTYETQWCCVCNMTTNVLTYRVPEYTRSGDTALNRSVMYSDGTLIGGKGKGNLDDGTPGVNSSYTGYHWTKSICENCGTINSVNGYDSYDFNNNVYSLNACDHNFFVAFDATTHVPYDDEDHLTTLKQGEYCQFCKGTYAVGVRGLAEHNFIENIDGQVGNNRFYVDEICEDCGYKTSEYVTAKAVVSSYYGVEDGEAHTLTVTDLSDNGVRTSVRYGTEADRCTKTSAPNYTQPGYYTVYYEIDYSYAGEVMTENGVSYVWIVADDEESESSNGTIIVLPPQNHEHEFHYLETIKPSCTELGYERFQCAGCGELDKRNYIPATGHDYDEILIREATCERGGLVLTLCNDCGDFYQTTTALGDHVYKTTKHNATCQSVGYTEHICEVCGDNYITNMTPLVSHSYLRITKQPTCVDQGYTTSTCTMCGYNYVTDYTEATGHSWDEGTTITNSTCDGEGVIEYKCEDCGEKMIKATSANGHNPGKKATCTSPQICLDCGTILEDAKGHSYSAEVTEPTCTSMGFTTYTCDDCGDTYDSDYVDKAEHDYDAVITEPTCTEHGFTTYSCKNCDDEYVSDYVDAVPHDYNAVVTAPTCTEMGFTSYTCKDCGNSYVNDYTNMVEHNYNKEVVEPTCTEHGYSVYTCPDCGKSYIGDYVDNKEHTYTETVVPPTCTTMGYTIFDCNDCDDSYKGNYIDALGHTPSDWIIDTPATIEHAGEKHIECTVCGEVMNRSAITQLADKDRTDEDGDAVVGGYDISLADENGKPIFDSEIIIDVLDNITIKLPGDRLLDYNDRTSITVTKSEEGTPAAGLNIYISDSKDNNATGKTDENGKLLVPNSASSTGDTNGTIGTEEDEAKMTYVVSITNKENVVIDNCDIRIGESNDIVIDLPDGLVLTEDSPAIVTVLDQNGVPQQGVDIIVIGDKDYIEKGSTDVYGKLTVPNVYEGYTDKDGRVHVNGHNVFVNDEQGAVENAFVKMNEDGTVAVTLPEGKKIDHHNRTTVSIYDRMGVAIKDVSVTVNDTTGASKTDVTNENGQMVVPPLNEDYTDAEGNAKVNAYDVKITDETAPVAAALVFYDEEHNEIVVALPADKLISYSNRITVYVSSEGNSVSGMKVAVMDVTEAGENGVTDENGIMVVPPLNKDMTDAEGNAVVNGTKVHVADADKNIENAFVVMNEDGTISITLPDGAVLAADNRIVVTLKDSEDKPLKDISVSVTDAEGKTEKDLTNENGQAFVPPVATDYTDVNGYAEVDGYAVTVADETKAIEKALVTLGEDNKISVKLPVNTLFDYNNRISVTVVNRADNTPVKDMTITATETIIEVIPEPEDKPDTGKTETEGTANGDASSDNSDEVKPEDDKEEVKEPETVEKAGKTLTGISDENGKVIFPPANEDITDGEGNSGITEVIPGKGEDTDGDGTEDKPGVNETVTYKVTVNDTKGVIPNALVKISDKKVSVTLPEGYTLTTSNQTTVTVKDVEDKAVQGVSVTITDGANTSKSGTTNSNGQVTLPVKSSGGGSSGGGSYSGGGGGGGSYSSTSISVVDKDGKTVSVSRSVSTTKATLTLPTGKTLEDGYYTITVKSGSKAKADYTVVLKDKKGNEATGVTDDNGVVTLPGVEHKAYIVGYPNGEFRPEGNMSRAEAAAIFARLIADEKGENITGKASFKDVASNEWYSSYVGYLEKYDVIKGYTDGTFKPEAPVTRAEFVAMSVRFYDLFEDVTRTNSTKQYTDVSASYWAAGDIGFATNQKWLNGYADGSFKPDININRAEVVTVVNRATGRTPDKEYISENYTKLDRFTDVKDSNSWYFFEVHEASNDHMAYETSDNENWLR